MNIFLDDIRNPTDAYLHLDTNTPKVSLVEHSGIHQDFWVVVRTYDEFTSLVTTYGLPEVVSFDHDLDEEHMQHYFTVTQKLGIIDYINFKVKTGKHCADFLVQEWIKQGKPKTIKTFVHSANRWGQVNIKNALKELY